MKDQNGNEAGCDYCGRPEGAGHICGPMRPGGPLSARVYDVEPGNPSSQTVTTEDAAGALVGHLAPADDPRVGGG